MAEPARRKVLLAGLGNAWGGDDGVGLATARLARDRASGAGEGGIEVRELPGEPIGLLEAWRGFDGAVVVDAMRSGESPGTILRFEPGRQPLPARLHGNTSTHAIGLAAAIELARALGRLPPRLIVLAVEGRSFVAGAELSAELQAIVPHLARVAVDEALALALA